MAAEVHSLILGLGNTMDSRDHNIDMEKIEQDFRLGLGTVFAEVKDVELKSNDEIAKMSNEEFLLELENLDKKYSEKIDNIIKKQALKELKLKEEKKTKLEAEISSLKSNLSKLDINSSLYDSYQSALDAAKKQLSGLGD